MGSIPENPNEFLLIPKWINEDYFIPFLEKDVLPILLKLLAFCPLPPLLLERIIALSLSLERWF